MHSFSRVMRRSTLATICLVLWVALSAVPASADTILFNSFGAGDSFSDIAGFFGFEAGEEGDPDSRRSRAFPFVPHVTARFRTAELPLLFPCCDSIPGEGSLVINLFDSEGDLPGRILETFFSTEPIDLRIALFASSARPLLQAGHTYWLEATTAGIAAGIWPYSPDESGPFRRARRTDNGPWHAVTDPRFTAAFRITGDAAAPVPEPSSILLLGAGLAAAAWRRRMKKPR